MRKPRTFVTPPDDDLADRVILSVRTKGFESEVEVPIPVTPADLDKFVMSWLDMMHQALKMPHAAKAA